MDERPGAVRPRAGEALRRAVRPGRHRHRHPASDAVAIVGPSGSGKTSLLHVLAGILRADDGQILLAGQRIDHLGEKKRSELRRTEFGFVFQSGMLVAELSAEENVALPSLLAGLGRKEAIDAGRQSAFAPRPGRQGAPPPGELSGGEASASRSRGR